MTWLSALNVGEPRDLDGEIFCALLSFLSAYLVAFWLCDSVIFGDQHCPCPLPLHLPLAPCVALSLLILKKSRAPTTTLLQKPCLNATAQQIPWLAVQNVEPPAGPKKEVIMSVADL